MNVLRDTHVDIKQEIERLTTQGESITREQVVTLEAELERRTGHGGMHELSKLV